VIKGNHRDRTFQQSVSAEPRFGGRHIYGIDIGILLLDVTFPRIVGDVGNALSYPFPVLFDVVHGATGRRVVEGAGAGLLDDFASAAERVVAQGVRGLVTSCGFLAIYQRELAERTSVPVATSSLLQIPLALSMLRRNQKIAVLTMDARFLTQRHFAGVGVGRPEARRLVIVGLEGTSYFYPRIHEFDGQPLDPEVAEHEIVDIARDALAQAPEIGAFVFECTNLAPYSMAVRRATGCPVFDIVSLVRWLHEAVHSA